MPVPVDLDSKPLGETTRSFSKARMSMKSSALVLIHRQRNLLEHDADSDGYDSDQKKRIKR